MIGQNRPVFQLNLLKGGQYNYFWEKGKFLLVGSWDSAFASDLMVSCISNKYIVLDTLIYLGIFFLMQFRRQIKKLPRKLE